MRIHQHVKYFAIVLFFSYLHFCRESVYLNIIDIDSKEVGALSITQLFPLLLDSQLQHSA